MHVGISLGIALYPDDGKDADTLLKNADMALYRGKSEGRNVYRFFEPGMDAMVRERQALETDLEAALPRREFELDFQPIMNIASGDIVGAEALMRWHSPARGLVSPDDFIPAAEETGLIVQLGDWAMRKACTVGRRLAACDAHCGQCLGGAAQERHLCPQRDFGTGVFRRAGQTGSSWKSPKPC